MTQYYLSPTGSDAGDGSSSKPWATFAKADSVVQPGDVVHLLPGTYPVPAAGIALTANGKQTAPIKYVSDQKWGAKLVPSANSSNNTVIDVQGTDTIIQDLEIDGSSYNPTTGGTCWSIGIYMRKDRDRASGCHVHDLQCVSQSSGGGIVPEGFYSGADMIVDRNLVHHIGPGNVNTIHGIYSQCLRAKIYSNIIYRSSGWAITLYHDGHQSEIMHNTVFNNDSGGINVSGGGNYNLSGNADYCYVANNISVDHVFNANGYGLDEFGTVGAHDVWTNNLVFNNTTAASLLNGLSNLNPVTADPQFINYIRTGGGDYRLASGSPAIGAGIATRRVPCDFFGRPFALVPSIGACEYASQ